MYSRCCNYHSFSTITSLMNDDSTLLTPNKSSTPSAIRSPLSETSSLSNVSSPLRKAKFDDRSQTRIGLALRSHSQSKTVSSVPSSLSSVNGSNYNDTDSKVIHWNESQSIASVINSGDFIIRYGTVTFLEPSSIYIAVGTDNGFVVLFNYHQDVALVLSPHQLHHDNGSNINGSTINDSTTNDSTTNDSNNNDPNSHLHSQQYIKISSVTSIAFSSDLTCLCAGYINGDIIMWDLTNKPFTYSPKTIAPYYIIHPINLQDRFVQNKEGHLRDVSIIVVRFVIDLNTQIISTDSSGLIFYHYGFKRFLNKYFKSQKLFGKNDVNTNNLDPRSHIYDTQVLPIGSSHQITDSLGLVAVITGSKVVVLSVLSLNDSANLCIRNHYQSTKPKGDNSIGCINWYPCMKIDKNRVENAKLAYSWGNCITVLQLNNDSFPPNLLDVVANIKDKDKGIPKLPISKSCEYFLDDSETIVSLEWLSHNTLCVFSKRESAINLTIFHYVKESNNIETTLKVVGREGLPINDVLSLRIPSSYNDKMLSFKNSIKVIKNKIFLLLNPNSHRSLIHIGSPVGWADNLIELLSLNKYLEALTTSYYFYTTDNVGQIVLLGLPEEINKRQSLVNPYLINIMKETVHRILDNTFNNENYLSLYFDILSMFEAQNQNTDDVMDLLESLFEFNDERIYFDVLEDYLITNSIGRLPPIILRNLVQYYATNNKGDLLTEILCTIDVTPLDIDLTIQICNKFHLNDCLIFIWNYLLNDYSTPFINFIDDIKNFGETDDTLKVFTYMSYILTGRQYPIDKFIDMDREIDAKNSLIKILFSHNLITQYDQGETIFPYLTLLLKFNSFEMLSTLNEFFEDTILNEDSFITRQYIIDALLDIFDVNEFTKDDKCNLSIFISRNYPKYCQFLRLSDSVLNEMIENLLNFNSDDNKIDCELGLQSLLSIFEPFDEKQLITKLKLSKFYNVLINIYKSEGMYHRTLQLWMEKYDQDLLEDYGYDKSSLVLEDCLRNAKPGTDRANLIKFIKNNFEKFIHIDMTSLVTLVDKFEPNLHEVITSVGDANIRYDYLSQLFKILHANQTNSNLIVEYIKLLCQFDKGAVYDFLLLNYQWLPNFEPVKLILKDNQQIDGLSILLLEENKYEESLQEILNKFHELYKQGDIEIFDYYYNLFIKICEMPGTYKDEGKKLNLNETMWLSLINKLIEFTQNDNSEFLNEKIYQSFRKISDVKLNPNDKNETSFLKIFNNFLENSQNITTLLNIKKILQEIIISYSYESEILRIGYKIINENISHQIKIIEFDHLKGWSISCKYCTNCNKPLFGGKIHKNNFLAWEQTQLKKLFPLENKSKRFITNKDFHHLTLVFFKCGHGYHQTCLKNLSSEEQCIICSQ